MEEINIPSRTIYSHLKVVSDSHVSVSVSEVDEAQQMTNES